MKWNNVIIMKKYNINMKWKYNNNNMNNNE